MRSPTRVWLHTIDCQDGSDESSCDIIIFEDFYNHEVPAPADKTLGTGKSKIYIGVKILKILAINEVDSTISLQFQLDMKWKDSRLTFKNLKEESHYNALSSKMSSEIWCPVVIFDNTEFMLKSLVSKIMFWPSFNTIFTIYSLRMIRTPVS